jgi:hypothetical protein
MRAGLELLKEVNFPITELCSDASGWRPSSVRLTVCDLRLVKALVHETENVVYKVYGNPVQIFSQPDSECPRIAEFLLFTEPP